MNIWSILTRARALFPTRPAVVCGARRLDYRSLAGRAAALAVLLREHGVGAGDRISVLEDNSLEMLEIHFAAAAAGAVLNPLNTRLSTAELTAILDDAGSRCVLARSALADPHDAALQGRDVIRIGGDEYRQALRQPVTDHPESDTDTAAVAHLYYTSGTTGRAKGVMLTHGNVCTHALAAIAELQITDADVWAHIAPMFHLADAWASFAITWRGGCHVMLPRFEPAAALALLEQHRATLTNLVPTMLTAMLAEPDAARRDLSHLRLLLSGGAPIAPDTVRQLETTFGCPYAQTYGMTETSPYLTISLLHEALRQLPPDRQLAYRCKTGRPFLGVELRVADERGRPVADDDREVGEIQVRGPTVTPGYWNQPDATAEAFTDGWLRTGDLAVLDREGYVTIVDRKKDVILTGGETVHSIEVENALYRHPAVLEAAVFGVPDPVWGERVSAAVTLHRHAATTAAALEATCREHLAGFKVPRDIYFLERLPRTGSGKINKRVLRERLRD